MHVLFFWGGGVRCVFFFVCAFGGGGGGAKNTPVLGKNSCDRGSHSELKSLTPCRYFCLGREKKERSCVGSCLFSVSLLCAA